MNNIDIRSCGAILLILGVKVDTYLSYYENPHTPPSRKPMQGERIRKREREKKETEPN